MTYMYYIKKLNTKLVHVNFIKNQIRTVNFIYIYILLLSKYIKSRFIYKTQVPNLGIMIKCDKCGKIFSKQSHLKNHINRKIPCVSIENIRDGITCEFCNNNFSSIYSLNRHLSRCAIRKTPELLLKYIKKQKE